MHASVAYLGKIGAMKENNFDTALHKLPNGAYDVIYQNRRYLLRKETLLEGKLIKLYAHDLGGNDIVSGNYYPTIKNGTLKPCEMSEAKVRDFVLNAELL